MTSKGSAWDWLIAQLVVNIGRFVDWRLPDVTSAHDNVRAQVEAPQLDDDDALDDLAMARGVDGAAAFNPEDLVKHANMLGRTKKLFKARTRWTNIALRYFLAGRREFQACTKFSHTVDASRFRVDSLEGLMGGLVENDAEMGDADDLVVQWSPPQEHSLEILKSHLNVKVDFF